MIIDSNVNNIEVEGQDENGIKAKIEDKNLPFILDLITRQQYRDPIGSIIREITSNCFDSHAEANVDDPVIIKFGYNFEGYFIEFIDVGVGMSPERIEQFMSYGESTKRLTNNQTGGFGLGGKSPLAYSDLFYLTTIKDGIEYKYVIYKTTKLPQCDLLIQSPIEKRNGTTIKIPIKNISDQEKFIIKCKEQLRYFDNVVILGTSIENNYTIYEGNAFKLRSDILSGDSDNLLITDSSINNNISMHIVIGKVSYPIDWLQLNRNCLYIPVAVKFDIGELIVTPERESIRYVPINGKETKDIINERIELVIRELTNRYKKQEPVYLSFYSCDKLSLIEPHLTIGNLTLNLSQIIKKVNVVIRDFEKFQDLLKYFGSSVLRSWSFDYDILKKRGNKKNLSKDVDLDFLDNKLIEIKGKKSLIKNLYLVYQFREVRLGKLGFIGFKRFYNRYRNKVKSIKELIDLKNKLEAYIKSKISNYGEYIVPNDYISRYRQEKPLRKEDEIVIYHTINNYCKQFVKVSDLRKFTGFIIYGFNEDKELLNFFSILLSHSKYNTKKNADKFIHSKASKVIKISNTNAKYIKHLKNAVHVKDFIGDNKVFKHFATSLLIRKERKYNISTTYGLKFYTIMENILPEYYEIYTELDEYEMEFIPDKKSLKNYNKIIDSIIDVAEQFNLINEEIYLKHKKLNNYVEKLELLKYIELDKSLIFLIVDFLVLKNKKVASIWTNPKQWEVELIDESLDKINYLTNVLSNKKTNLDNFIYLESLKNYHNYVKAA